MNEFKIFEQANRITDLERQLAEAQQRIAELVTAFDSEQNRALEAQQARERNNGILQRTALELGKCEAECDTLRGLLHEAEEVMHFPINDKRLVEVRERITAALKEGE